MSRSPELRRSGASLSASPGAAFPTSFSPPSFAGRQLPPLGRLSSPQPPSALGLSNLIPDRQSSSYPLGTPSCSDSWHSYCQRGASDLSASYGGSSASSYLPAASRGAAREEASPSFALNTFDFTARRSRATSISSLRSTYEPSAPASPTAEGELFFADWTLTSPMRPTRGTLDMELSEHADAFRALRPFDGKHGQSTPAGFFTFADASMSPPSPTSSLSDLSDFSTTADCGGADTRPDVRRLAAISPPNVSSDEADFGAHRYPWAAAHRQLKHWLADAPEVLRASRLAEHGVTAGNDVPKAALRRAAAEGDMLVSTPSPAAGQAMQLVLERQHSRRATKSSSSSPPSTTAALCDALTVHQFVLPASYVSQSLWHTPDTSRLSCLRWNGDVWLTVHDVIAVLVFRLACLGFEIETAAARAKLSEGAYSDLRACFEVRDFLAIEAGSSVLKAFASIGAVKSTKTQRVYRWGAICHDRLLVSALQRDVERVSKGVEVVCVAVREPALSLRLTSKPDVATQLGINDSPTVPPSILSVFAFGAPPSYALGRGYRVLRAASENITVAWDLPAGRNGRARRSSSPYKPKPSASSAKTQPAGSRSAPRLSAALPATTPTATGSAVATRSRSSAKTLAAALA